MKKTIFLKNTKINKNKKYIKIYQRHEMQGIKHENEKNKYYKK